MSYILYRARDRYGTYITLRPAHEDPPRTGLVQIEELARFDDCIEGIEALLVHHGCGSRGELEGAPRGRDQLPMGT